MIIRRAIKEDMIQVLDLIKELALYEREPDAVVLTVDDLIGDGFSENPLFQCFVADIQGTIVGIALYYYRYSTWKGKTIHLEDLIVRENNRGTGIGSALYKEIIVQAKHDNVRRIEWAVLDWNTPAIDFYTKSGANVLEDWRVVQMNENGINQFLKSHC
jgi:GNAT superfamily N-acetyltransferase